MNNIQYTQHVIRPSGTVERIYFRDYTFLLVS